MIPKYLTHPSTIVLILINLLTIYIALVEQWDVFVLMILYIIQGLIICFFHYFKVLRLEKIDTTDFEKNFNLTINGQQCTINGLSLEEAKKKAANFFLFGFLFANFVYLIFIGAYIGITSDTIVFSEEGIFSTGFILLIIGYFLTHAFSFIQSKEEAKKEVNLGNYLHEPFARIIPMHLTIIIGGYFINTQKENQFLLLILFLIIKGIFDVHTHIQQHEKYLTPTKKATTKKKK